MKAPQRRKKSNWAKLFFLHRYIGLSIALFAIVLSVTGILLNHTEALKLHDRNVSTSWLMSLYGIKSPQIKTAYAVGDTWVVEMGDSLYLNQQPLKCKTPLKGAVAQDELIIIASPSQLCLVTLAGELVDYLVLDAENTLTRLGEQHRNDKNPTVIVDTTQEIMSLNADYTVLSAISPTAQATNQWQTSATPPAALTQSLITHYQGDGLPYERIILDLHSGRIVGIAGVYFMDFIALLLIFIALSGVAMWAKRAFGWR